MKQVLLLFLLLFVNASTFAQQYFQVATETLNVRQSANTNAEVIFQLNLGDSLKVLNQSRAWSKVELGDGSIGYVASKFISEKFKDYKQKAVPTTSSKGIPVWQLYGIVGLILLILIIASFNSSSASSKSRSNSSKSGASKTIRPGPKPTPAANAKNAGITQVKLDGSWFRVYNSDGKQLSVMTKGSSRVLLGYGPNLILMEEGDWYRTYDFNFKPIAVKSVPNVCRFLGVSGDTITMDEGDWIRTYDAHFKQLNVRSARV